jgi:hypothetical protein
MFKTSTVASYKLSLRQITEAFNNHQPITVKKLNGQTVGPGFIAIMYGSVAFRMYPKNAGESSHFVRIEEVAEIATTVI